VAVGRPIERSTTICIMYAFASVRVFIFRIFLRTYQEVCRLGELGR